MLSKEEDAKNSGDEEDILSAITAFFDHCVTPARTPSRQPFAFPSSVSFGPFKYKQQYK